MIAAKPLSPTIEEAIDYIYKIDFSMIINKMVQSGWARSTAEALSHEYRNFLFLQKKYAFQTQIALPPSEELDEFWHNHILDTHKYIHDCKMIFGEYLHHYPYFGIDDKSDQKDLANAFENTQKYYFAEFKKEMPKITHRFSLVLVAIKKMLSVW